MPSDQRATRCIVEVSTSQILSTEVEETVLSHHDY